MRCLHGSEKVIKNGHTSKGVQRYRCKEHGKTFICWCQRVRTPRDQVEAALILLQEGEGDTKEIAKMFGVQPRSLRRWFNYLKKQQCPKCREWLIEDPETNKQDEED